MREHLKIVTNPFPTRNEGMERRLVEYHRETLLNGMLIAGSILILVAIMW